MRSNAAVISGRVSFILVVLIGLIGLSTLIPSTALALHTDPGTFFEDPAIQGCSHCHGIMIAGGNRNGSDRVITGDGARYHVKESDWSATVARMIGKSSPADPAAAPAYLNTNYCSTCTGVIMSSPAVVNIKDTSATIIWSTSLNGREDGPADSVVFYGTSPVGLTSCATCQVSDPTMTGAHSVTLTGLTASKKYYFQYQSTGADGKIVQYLDTPSFKTTATPGGPGGGTTTSTFAYVANYSSNSISVVDVDKALLQTAIFVDKSPTGIVASPDGKTVYVSEFAVDTTTYPPMPFNVNDLIVIDTATNTIKNTVHNITQYGTGGQIPSLAISPNGQYLYGMHWPNELLAISTADLSIVKSTILPLPCSQGCGQLAVSPDGATIYAVSGTYFNIAVKIDAASAVNPAVSTVVTPINLPTGSAGAAAVAIGPDNRAWIPGVYANTGSFAMVQPNGTASLVPGMDAGYGVAVTKMGDTVFSSRAANINEDFQVAALDPDLLRATLSPGGTFASHRPMGVALTSDDAKLLVSAYCNAAVTCPDLLYIINPTTWEILGSVTVGASPGQIAVATVITGVPAGPPPTLIYSANGAANNVSVIDTGTNTITATIPVGTNPLAVAPTPDAKLVYVVNGDSTVSVITRATQTVTATITLPDPIGTNGLASAIVGPGNNVLYVANHNALKIYVINTSNNTITATIPLGSSYWGPLDLAITPDGGTLYVSVDAPPGYGAGNGYIAVVSTASNSVVRNITLPNGATSTAGNRIAMNPLGGYLYATVDPYLVVIETGSDSVITTSQMYSPAGRCLGMPLEVMPDGTTVAVSCYSTLYTYDTGTLQSTGNSGSNITNGLGPIAFKADGSMAYIASQGSGSVDVIDTTTLGAPVATIALPAMSNMVASSPAVRSITGGTPVSLTAPDLAITSLSATSPVNLSTLNNITITDTVANIGVYKAGSFVINYYFSPTNFYNSATAVVIGSRSITGPFNLAATSTATSTFTVDLTATAIAAGNYYVIAFADANQEIAEANEDNNKAPTAGAVSVVVADLVETAVSSPAIGTTVLPGTVISITDTVVNQGSGSAGGFGLGYFLVPTQGGTARFLGNRIFSSLAAGASSTGTVSIKLPSSGSSGTFYLRAFADYTGAIPESDETNNYLNTSTTLTISGTPDTTPPTAPTNLAATVASGSQINLTWTPSTDNISVASYEVWRCTGSGCTVFAAIPGATPTTASYNNTGLTAGTTYRYEVRARDSSGNLSGFSAIVTATTLSGSDTVPPANTTAANFISAGATYATSTAVTLALAATDAVGVTGYYASETATAPTAGAAGWVAITATTSYAATVNFTLSTTNATKTVYVWFKDAAGNVSLSTSDTIILDTTTPTLSVVASSAITTSGATITWTTNEASDSQVDYGTTTGYGSSTTLNTALVTSHSQALSGLSASTLYHYRVKSRDAAGNLTTGTDNSFTTAAAADTTAPANTTAANFISAGAAYAASTAVTLALAATDAVGVTGYYASESATAPTAGAAGWVAVTSTTTYSASVAFTLSTGDATKTVYVWFKDAAGNVSTAASDTIILDTTVPTLSAVTSGSITSSGATITWTTNEASDSQVDYGTTTSYGSSTTLNTSLVTSHSQALSGLSASTLYHYRVKSRDAAGNLATGTDGTFTTSAAAAPDLIITAVSTTATSVTRPGTISITYTVKNQGTSAAPAFYVGLYLSTDNVITTSDRYLGSSYLSAGLAAGATSTKTVSMTVGTSIPAGTYYVGAYADYSGVVVESSETNNGKATAGTIVVH